SMRWRASLRPTPCGICPIWVLDASRAGRRSVSSLKAGGQIGKTTITRSRRFSISATAWCSSLYGKTGHPVGSKGRVQARHGDVWEWVRGKLVRLTSSYDIDEARAAAERLAAKLCRTTAILAATAVAGALA